MLGPLALVAFSTNPQRVASRVDGCRHARAALDRHGLDIEPEEQREPIELVIGLGATEDEIVPAIDTRCLGERAGELAARRGAGYR